MNSRNHKAKGPILGTLVLSLALVRSKRGKAEFVKQCRRMAWTMSISCSSSTTSSNSKVVEMTLRSLLKVELLLRLLLLRRLLSYHSLSQGLVFGLGLSYDRTIVQPDCVWLPSTVHLSTRTLASFGTCVLPPCVARGLRPLRRRSGQERRIFCETNKRQYYILVHRQTKEDGCALVLLLLLLFCQIVCV